MSRGHLPHNDGPFPHPNNAQAESAPVAAPTEPTVREVVDALTACHLLSTAESRKDMYRALSKFVAARALSAVQPAGDVAAPPGVTLGDTSALVKRADDLGMDLT